MGTKLGCIRCNNPEKVRAGVCEACLEKKEKEATKELKAWWRGAKKALKRGERVMPPGWTLEKKHEGRYSDPPCLKICVGGLPFTGGYGFTDHSYECATEHAWGYYGMPLEVLLDLCEAKFGTSRTKK